MSICSRCGGGIRFRTMDGQVIPMGGGCSCITINPNLFNERYDRYDEPEESCSSSSCYATQCPECGGEVYFIKHNGGSVWLDPPLGQPWHKHGCFEFNDERLRKNYQKANGLKKTLVSMTKNSNRGDRKILGVVVSVQFRMDQYDSVKTRIILKNNNKNLELFVLGDGRGLLGELCFYSSKNQTISILSSMFKTYKTLSYKW